MYAKGDICTLICRFQLLSKPAKVACYVNKENALNTKMCIIRALISYYW